MERLTDDLNIISSLPDQPALTSNELKGKFDEAGNKIKTFINEHLLPELEDWQGDVSEDIAGQIEGLEQTVNDSLAELQSTIEGEMESLSSSLTSEVEAITATATKYGDFEITSHSSGKLDNGSGGHGGFATKDITITKEGYFPLGIVGYTSTSTNHYNSTSLGACLTELYLTSRANGSCVIHGKTFVSNNQAWTYSSTFTAYVLWVKVKNETEEE